MAIAAINDESVGTLTLGDIEVRRLGFGAMRITGRTPKGIPSERVTAFNQFGLRYAYRCRRARSTNRRTLFSSFKPKNAF